MWTSPIYEQTIRKYHKADGWKAILVYLMVLALVFSSAGFTERILFSGVSVFGQRAP